MSITSANLARLIAAAVIATLLIGGIWVTSTLAAAIGHMGTGIAEDSLTAAPAQAVIVR